MNPVVLITGASSGIGKGLALAFAKANYTVVINYSKNKEAALEVARECTTLGAQTKIIACDVRDANAVNDMVSDILQTYGQIDVCINNSGITKDGLVLRMREEDFDEVLDTNLKGAFHVTQAVMKPMMKARSGRIINMSSVIGIIGNVGQANYAASKGGLIAFTKSVAKELASRNITVNAIAPGFIETRMTDILETSLKESILKQIPCGRFGSVEDVAQTALFLASSHAQYINGQVIHVDGGMVM